MAALLRELSPETDDATSEREVSQAQARLLDMLGQRGFLRGEFDLADRLITERNGILTRISVIESMLVTARPDVSVSEFSARPLRGDLGRALFWTIAMGIVLIGLALLAVWFVFGAAPSKTSEDGR
jgi:hypothetical protein